MHVRNLAPFLIALCACHPSTPPPPTGIVAAPCARLPEAPDDPAWDASAEFPAELLLQDMVEPRLLERSTPLLRVRALLEGARVAFRIAWQDATRDDEVRPGEFSDACAVQLPGEVSADMPAPQMGEPGKAVQIVLWRACWQAALEGGGVALTDLYPNASIDHYPFEAKGRNDGSSGGTEMALRYAPARAVENAFALPRTSAVQTLVANGPGTLRPAPGDATGTGVRTSDGWAVVIACPLPPGSERFERTQVAFAVWEGSRGEVGARKMRTAWVPFSREVRP